MALRSLLWIRKADEHLRKVGGDLVTADTLDQVYSPATGMLRVTVPQPLEPNQSYRICCRAADTLGNETEEDAEAGWLFPCTDRASLGSLTVPTGAVTAPGPFSVTLPFSDCRNVSSVTLLRAAGDMPLELLQMQEDWAQDSWTAELTPIPGADALTITAPLGTAELPSGAAAMKLFWLDETGAPLCRSVEILT